MAEKKFIVDLNLDGNQLINADIERLSVAPGSPSAGRIYFDTELDVLRYFDGTAWVDVGTGGESGEGGPAVIPVLYAVNTMPLSDVAYEGAPAGYVFWVKESGGEPGDAPAGLYVTDGTDTLDFVRDGEVPQGTIIWPTYVGDTFVDLMGGDQFPGHPHVIPANWSFGDPISYPGDYVPIVNAGNTWMRVTGFDNLDIEGPITSVDDAIEKIDEYLYPVAPESGEKVLYSTDGVLSWEDPAGGGGADARDNVVLVTDLEEGPFPGTQLADLRTPRADTYIVAPDDAGDGFGLVVDNPSEGQTFNVLIAPESTVSGLITGSENMADMYSIEWVDGNPFPLEQGDVAYVRLVASDDQYIGVNLSGTGSNGGGSSATNSEVVLQWDDLLSSSTGDIYSSWASLYSKIEEIRLIDQYTIIRVLVGDNTTNTVTSSGNMQNVYFEGVRDDIKSKIKFDAGTEWINFEFALKNIELFNEADGQTGPNISASSLALGFMLDNSLIRGVDPVHPLIDLSDINAGLPTVISLKGISGVEGSNTISVWNETSLVSYIHGPGAGLDNTAIRGGGADATLQLIIMDAAYQGDVDGFTNYGGTVSTTFFTSGKNIGFNNSGSNLVSDNVEAAIKEIDNSINNISVANFAENVIDTNLDSVSEENDTIPSAKAVKEYVDDAIQGLSWKQPARAATTSNIDLASGLANESVVDGVTLATGDRVLVKDQSAGAQNGIYIVQASGPAIRSGDADTGVELVKAAVLVVEGTVNGHSSWVVNSVPPIDLGVDDIVWTQFGSGVSQASEVVSGVTRYATDLEVSSHADVDAAVRPKNLKKKTNGRSVPLGNGVDTTFVIDLSGSGADPQVHGHTIVQLFETDTGQEVGGDLRISYDNVREVVILTVSFNNAPTENQFSVNIIGSDL